MIITIDGPSGTGKTSVARLLAERLKFVYFDTGAMYRAVTWFALEHHVDTQDQEGIERLLGQFSFHIQEDRERKRYFVGEQEVTDVIRLPHVTARVSTVSAFKSVRSFLLRIQHEFAKNRDVVFEGRDLGSVVFPDAEVKIFLTASPDVRAERRYHELMEKYPQSTQGLDKDAILADLERRDRLDSSREIAPLTCPVDAITIDTSRLTIQEVVEKIALHTYEVYSQARKGNRLYRLIIMLTQAFYKLFYRHKVYGAHHFCMKGAIIASNHVSNLDPPALAISSPEEVHFLAKEALFKPFLFGGLIRALNAHPVTGSSGDVAVLKMICKLLVEGKKVLLFPEGKRNIRDELDELKPGIAVLVSRSKTAVIPAYIHGTFAIWNRKRSLPKLSGKTACVFGAPIFWKDFEHLEKKEAAEQFTAHLAASINRLKDWYIQGAKGEPP